MGGGGGSIFCPCLCFNINQCNELKWCNWVFAEMVQGVSIMSWSFGFHFHFFSDGNACLHPGMSFTFIVFYLVFAKSLWYQSELESMSFKVLLRFGFCDIYFQGNWTS